MEERYIYFCNVTNARFCNSVGFGGNYEDFVAAASFTRYPFTSIYPLDPSEEEEEEEQLYDTDHSP